MFISGCDSNLEKYNLEKTAVNMVEEHLRNKYPDETFSVKEVEVHEIYNGFVQRGWDDRVTVTVNSDNQEYTVIAYTGESYSYNNLAGKCIDNVQNQEVLNAIHDSIRTMFNIPQAAKTRIEIDMSTEYGNIFCFHERFNGEIVEFLKREEQHGRGCPDFIIHSYVNCDKIDLPNYKKHSEFLNSCRFVVCVNLDEQIPSYHIALHRDIKSVISTLQKKECLVKQVYWCDNMTFEFTDASDMLITFDK